MPKNASTLRCASSKKTSPPCAASSSRSRSSARSSHGPPARPKSIQGYYSTKEKTLFVYDDIAGNYERGVLVHEMVHALQDQHFKLDKLHDRLLDDDAALAKAALIEGDATFTMIELLKKDQPRIAMMLDTPLEKAKDVQRAFVYAQGARYVKAPEGAWRLEGGQRRYRFPPDATASILHPEGASTIDLGPGKVRGELAILQMFAANADTAPLAAAAAAGWKGDRTSKATAPKRGWSPSRLRKTRTASRGARSS